MPVDSDGDGICDGQDDVNDSEIYLNYIDDIISLIVNQSFTLNPYVYGGDVVTWEISPILPDNMTFDVNVGTIGGMPVSEFPSTNFTIWANNSQYSASSIMEISASLLDTDEDGIPDETDTDDDNDGWSDINEISCLTDTLDAEDMPVDSDGDGICDGQDDVDDSPLYLIYSSTSQNLFVNEPMNILIATVYGGDVREWEISPELPAGLNLDTGISYRSIDMVGTGLISGAPMNEFPLTTFTVWSNNSQYSDSVVITLKSSIPYIDDTIFELLYLDSYANLTVNIDELYLEPEIFGGNITNWSVSPEMPEGLDFNITNGVVSGIALDDFNETIFTIVASNSLFIDEYNLTIVAHHLDTDGDGIPDFIDDDNDGDGWNDTDEEECGADSLEFYIFPDDLDEDGLCDILDSVDDSPILFFYPNDKIMGTVGVEINPIIPRIAPSGGDILRYEVFPQLPDGLVMDNITGIISGVPLIQFNHLILEYSHRIKASNGQYEFEYTVDFDILPALIENLDADGDGWSNDMETNCGTSINDKTSFPLDIDKDGKCELMDDDDDGDGRADEIDDFANDSTAWDDTDGDGEPDEVTCQYSINSTECALMNLIEDYDDDGDGWNDTDEIDCATDPKNSTDVPIDENQNNICDRLDSPDITRVLWIICFPLVLLLLLLIWLLNPFGVDEEEIRGPEPPYTSSSHKFVKGSGEYDDPFVLKAIKCQSGKSIESIELIKITNITPRLKIDFINLSSDDDSSRFGMDEMKSNSRGEIEFRLQFNDFDGTNTNKIYSALMRVGRASVYFKWDISIIVDEESTKEEIDSDEEEIDSDEEEIVKSKEEVIEIQEIATKVVESEPLSKEEKKKQDLARVASKSDSIDFATMGEAAKSDIISGATRESSTIILSDASSFPDSGGAYIYDPTGDILLKWASKDGNNLIGVTGISKDLPIGAIIIQKDNLQDIKGVGPFIEEKLNALGIYTFGQISSMNYEIEDQVNDAIEFFPGRIRRDEWAKQAMTL